MWTTSVQPERGKARELLALAKEAATTANREFRPTRPVEVFTDVAVAEYFGMDRAAILFAFDNPRDRQHLLLEDAEQDRRREIGNRRMIELALELATSSTGKRRDAKRG